ncbi:MULTISPECIES: ArnT family glycosyltransferase [Paenibacillus]|uniref:ArnT family glycosyltransferase n=1 Tax=Paenibacillus TaxID=44249 RepID=UPI00096F9303|nr:glycosyltransferase family 39 protein [Paenibacillus odorifer]OME18771.1 hypothetical protein BSK60_01655 [Paenibacillus odorifer]
MSWLLLVFGIISYFYVIFNVDIIFLTPILGMALLCFNALLVTHIATKEKHTLLGLLNPFLSRSMRFKNVIRLPNIYRIGILFILAISLVLRLGVVDLDRDLVPGSDEYVYHYGAENLLKHGVLAFDREGTMFSGIQEIVPTTALSPGYPVYIAIIYFLFGHSTKAVLLSQLVLSVVSLILMFKILELLRMKKPYVLISLALAAIYPGLIYNIDRMLTEQLFMTLLLAFTYFFLKSLQNNNIYLLGLSAAILTCATHIRALALPFAALAILFLLVYGRRDKKSIIRNIVVFIGIIILFMLPWWIRNWITFDKFILFSDAGYSPKVWGAVPYFIDMTATNNQSLENVLKSNLTPNPAVYYKWRIFGFFQYMWGDLWDERLVHPFKYFRPLIALQQLIIVPCVIAIPFLLKKCRKEVLFLSCFPIAFTLMNMPFHGLPRYVYPSIPFVIILVGVLLERVVDLFKKREVLTSNEFLFKWQGLLERCFRYGFMVIASAFAIILFYSVYFFAYNINTEMSEYRLGRYLGTSVESVKSSEPVSSKFYGAEEVLVENSVSLTKDTFKNIPQAPSIIKVHDELLNDDRIVTEVDLNIQGGYIHDYMTIYWTGKNTKEISENTVYKFPINRFEKSQKIYIDDDVNFLMIVPAVFRGGSFTIDSVQIQKYKVQ